MRAQRLPKTLSIELVIVELFERIGHLLYSQAFVDDPARSRLCFRPAQTGRVADLLGDRPLVPGGPATCQHQPAKRRRTVPRPRRLPALCPELRPLDDRRAGWRC